MYKNTQIFVTGNKYFYACFHNYHRIKDCGERFAVKAFICQYALNNVYMRFTFLSGGHWNKIVWGGILFYPYYSVIPYINGMLDLNTYFFNSTQRQQPWKKTPNNPHINLTYFSQKTYFLTV